MPQPMQQYQSRHIYFFLKKFDHNTAMEHRKNKLKGIQVSSKGCFTKRVIDFLITLHKIISVLDPRSQIYF